jgi:hypothetical protein
LWLAFRVFDEPKNVFEELAARPRALVPIVLMILVFLGAGFGVPSDVLEEQAREQIEAFQERGQLTDEQAQEQIEAATSTRGRASGVGIGTALTLLGFLTAALIFWLIFGALGSEPIKFKAEFAVLAHAYMVSLLGAILAVGLAVFTDIDNPQLSLGFLFGSDSGFPYQFASRITLFGTWNVLLVALGNQVLSKKKGFAGPLLIVGGLWLLWKLGWATLMTVLAGLGG